MTHVRMALHRLRSAVRPRACSAFRFQCNSSLNPFSSSVDTTLLNAAHKLIHCDLPNQNILRFPDRCCATQIRRFSSSPSPQGSSSADTSGTETISVTFVDKDGDEQSIKVPLGMSMLEAAHQNDIELEGACEGSIACSTCHVIVMDEKYYNKLSEPTDEENDMLDLAFGLTERSRLGCQVIAKPELDGMRLAIPSATRNFAVDGYVPKPH